jgi:hypothetical protein|tara:strand:+ start:298 stop:654 length:357 start_codon:yes stop_codon:yes gene_type:complete
MATNATWTVIFDDKKIIKHGGARPSDLEINDDSFWNDSKWSNIWAIQYVDDNLDHNDTVEYRDTTPHKSWNQAGLGDFRAQFVSRWDAAHLAELQENWDNDSRDESEKGPRPTSYSSY